MDCRLLLAALLSSTSVYAAAAPSPSPEPAESCGQVGQWLKPAGERPSSYAAPTLLEQLAAQQVVLLGETHDRADDHRWQLDVLTALHRQRKRLAIGFEMFPRRLQPVLDRWVAGELSEAAFLEQAEWKKVWGYDAEFYLPLFRFAREHRLPMLALNVDRKLVQQVSARGWDAVPESERQGVSRPRRPRRGLPDSPEDSVRQPCRLAEGHRAASITSSTPRLCGIAPWPKASPPTCSADRRTWWWGYSGRATYITVTACRTSSRHWA
jgi:hypothetical protein